MRTLLSVLLITLLVTLFVPAPALASPIEVLGSCPVGYELHDFMEHTGEHMHTHIGIDRDLNGDGNICMKMLTNDLHLHVDNSFRLP